MNSTEIDALWNYSDPSLSEARFREALNAATGLEALEIRTQLARCLGLQRRFDEGFGEIEAVRKTRLAGSVVDARCDLEEGRLWNSSGRPDKARPLFESALAKAQAVGLDNYAVDAAHMVAIVCKGQEALDWNLRAIDMARSSSDERTRKWLGSLLNNTAWTLHDLGRCDEALGLFVQAEGFFAEADRPGPHRIARWSVARCLRSLGRVEEALARQQELAKLGEDAGYISEELGECLLALGRPEEARPHFAMAFEKLSRDEWLQANEPERLSRLKSLG